MIEALRTAAPHLALLAAIVVGACAAPAPVASTPVECGDTTVLPPPTTVLLISVDTFHRDFLGVHGPAWDTTPRLDALFAEGARLDHVIVPRGLSGPSMGSLVTGAYPRTHGLRLNSNSVGGQSVSELTPTLGERFAAAGYHTFGYLANQCYLLDEEMDSECTWLDPTIDQPMGDAAVATDLLTALEAVPADEPVFAWLHLLDPHDPYLPVEPWFSTFHPDNYEGPYAADTDAAIFDHMSGTLAYTDEDRAYVEAAYASQIASTDRWIGSLLDGLQASGRLDDAVVVFGIDHGEELAKRSTYFYHGCSPYNGVLDTTYAIWAPGRVPAGHVEHTHVSSTDIAPTIVDLAGLAWTGPAEGASLLPELRACAEPDRTVFFERGTTTAGVVANGWKYLLDPNAGFGECKYYDAAAPYPNAAEELYDLDMDPLEVRDLSLAEPARAAMLRAEVCAWVADGDWGGGEDNALVNACR